MNLHLLNNEVQRYLKQHEAADLARFVLNGSPFENIDAQELVQQLEGRKKAKNKLPSWHLTEKIYYPPKINLEQTSSEKTAEYKSTLFTVQMVADLTGGLGVDAYFFAQKAKKLDYFEQDAELAKIAAHNFDRLNAKNITVRSGNSIDQIILGSRNYDMIYADPSRRNKVKKKVFLLKDCAPNLPENLDSLFNHTEAILVKTSPLLDITAALDQLDYVREIHIVALKNEVKELLFLLKKNSQVETIKLITANIKKEKTEITSCDYYNALKAKTHYSRSQTYLYEPNAALMKSGLFNWIASEYNLNKIGANTHLYTSNEKIDFPGRIFKIDRILPYHKKTISKTFGGSQANITTRNFRERVMQLRKKYKITEGGEDYLFFTTDLDGKALVLACKKA